MHVTVSFSAEAEYSDALKESIKRQTEYLTQASPTMSNARADDIFTNILMQHGRTLQTPTCKVTNLHINNNHITDAGVASLCQALQTPACKVTELHLGCNQVTDAGVASICQALQTPTCKITKLDVASNQITDAGVASLCQALQTPTCKVTRLVVGGNQVTEDAKQRLMYILKEKCRIYVSYDEEEDIGK